MLKEWNPRIAEDAIVTYTIKLQNQNGTPINLTGSTIRSVCEDPNAISVQINNAQSGTISVRFTGTRPGSLGYEVWIDWSNGDKWLLLTGQLTVLPRRVHEQL